MCCTLSATFACHHQCNVAPDIDTKVNRSWIRLPRNYFILRLNSRRVGRAHFPISFIASMNHE